MNDVTTVNDRLTIPAANPMAPRGRVVLVARYTSSATALARLISLTRKIL